VKRTEQRIRDEVPQAELIYLEPDVYRAAADAPEPTP
jgi:hypothetical protein